MLATTKHTHMVKSTLYLIKLAGHGKNLLIDVSNKLTLDLLKIIGSVGTNGGLY